MRTVHHKRSLFLWSLLGAAFITLNLTIVQHPILGVPSLILYALPLGLWLAILLKEDGAGKIFFGLLALLSSIILLNTLFYYIYGITPAISLIILFIPLFTFLFKPKRIEGVKIDTKEKIKVISGHFYLILFFLIIEAVLLGILILNRTTGLMASPWMAVNPWFFILYAIATGILFYIVYNAKSSSIKIILSSVHLFITFIIAAVLYPLGYGFDAFVHRATEAWILNNGFIEPKQPYYIGQYGLVVWLSQLTKIPLFYVDIYLVPLLASLTIPAGIIYALKRAWDIPAKYSALFIWLIPFIPFLSLHLTTPHNLVLLFSVLVVFTALAFLNDDALAPALILMALAAVCAHPLVGAPIFIFALSVILIKKRKKNIFVFCSASALITSLILPAMFVVNNLRAGGKIPAFSNPLREMGLFFDLFKLPYWYAKTSPLIFEILYTWQRAIIPATLALAIIGFIICQKNSKNKLYYIFPFTAAGIVLGAWFLRSWIVFPDVVSYEQGDFPLRAIKASILFILPFISYLLSLILQWMDDQKKKRFFLSGLLILASMLLMLSLYLSYPQRNIKARFPGLNVTAADFEAVEWIHNQHERYDYIVLSNQLVSAAALTKYSFVKYFSTNAGEIFYFSIPTGGPLYKQYGKMLYEGQKLEYMEEAMKLTGVNTSYFVLNSYWANADKIIEGAKKTADSWQIIDNGKIWIFIYTK